MGKLSNRLTGLATALALTVVGCGDGITGVDSGDVLTPDEVAAVVAAFGSAFASAGVSTTQGAAGPAQAPISLNQSFDVSVECESGTFDVSGSMAGSVDDTTFDMDLTMNVRWQPNACVVGAGENTVTLAGAPRVELALEMTSSQEVVTMSGRETGGFSFTTSDGRTGSCAFDVTFSIVSDGPIESSTVTGTVCRLSASSFDTFGL